MNAQQQKTTDQLVVGDVVMHYGVRLVIDRPLRRHATRGMAGDVWHTAARIHNPDAVRHVLDLAQRDDDGNYRYPVQGNTLATWTLV